MIRRRIIVAILTICMVITSAVCPYAYAEAEDSTVREEQQQIISAWDEEGFYHDETGEVVKDTYMIVNDLFYKFDAEGKSELYSGEFDGTYYEEGLLYTGWLEGLRYKNGLPHTGWFNYKYYVKGRLADGIYENYYYNKGIRVTKYKTKVKKMSDGNFYFFKKDATVFKGTGWKRVDGKRYYFKNGKAYTGWHYIGNYKYYFRKDNARLCQDLIALQGSKWKKKDLMVKVNRTKNCVTIYAKDGKNGYTIPVKALACSVGKKSSPTIKGTYTMTSGSGRTYRWHLLGGPGISPYCYGQYCTRIHKSWLFHSVTYDKKDKMTLQTYTYNQLGTAASHGCVRLQVKDAKLIYDIVNYRDTKVKIYDSDYTGPFDKPVIKKIPKGQKYDPTDPFVKK